MFNKLIVKLAISQGGLSESDVILLKLKEAFDLYEQGKRAEAEQIMIESLAVHWEVFYKAAYSESDTFPELKPHYLAIAKHLHAMVARKGDKDAMSKAYLFESEQARPQAISFTAQNKSVLEASKDRRAWHLFYRLGHYYKQKTDATSQSKSIDFFEAGFQLCTTAAMSGSGPGMSDLGTTYLDGLAGRDKNPLEAVKWLTPVADKFALSTFELARAYGQLGDRKQQKLYLEKALEIIELEAASYGSVRIELAKLYIYGVEGQSNFPKAIGLLEEILNKEGDSATHQAKCWLAVVYTSTGIENESAEAYFKSTSQETRKGIENDLKPETTDSLVEKEVKVHLQQVFDQLKDDLASATSLNLWKRYTAEDVALSDADERIALLKSQPIQHYDSAKTITL